MEHFSVSEKTRKKIKLIQNSRSLLLRPVTSLPTTVNARSNSSFQIDAQPMMTDGAMQPHTPLHTLRRTPRKLIKECCCHTAITEKTKNRLEEASRTKNHFFPRRNPKPTNQRNNNSCHIHIWSLIANLCTCL